MCCSSRNLALVLWKLFKEYLIKLNCHQNLSEVFLQKYKHRQIFTVTNDNHGANKKSKE